MTMTVYRGRKATQQQQHSANLVIFRHQKTLSVGTLYAHLSMNHFEPI